MLSPKSSPRGKLLSQYVCARIIRLDEVDIGLFDYDRNNTLFYFAMNADEQIYLRYGGRDSQSQDTYLNLDSIELALKQGLELHEKYKRGELPARPRPRPDFARNYPLLVERTFTRNQCVECHLVGDFQNLHREQEGTLDKPRHLFRSPDIRNLGIQLDIPKGLVAKEVKGPAAAAGLQPGDRIAAVNGMPVYTFGDFQYEYDKVDRKATQTTITVDRAGGKPVDLTIALQKLWWIQDVRWRQSSVEPRLYFESRALTADEKAKLALKPDGFACEVRRVDAFAQMMKSHELKLGDIVFGVDGVEADPMADTAELYMKLNRKPGDAMTLDVLRGGKRIKSPLKSYRLSFRK